MTFDEFHKKYLGKKVGTGQCVALVKQYIDEVLEVKSEAIGNAKDYYENFENTYLKNYCTKISNTKDFVPIKGDIIVWNGNISSSNNYGHIAICTGEGDTHKFTSFDQNWGGQYGRDITHSYNCVYGVLRPNDQTKVNGLGTSKYKVGEYVEVDIPVAIAYDNGEESIVDSNGYQFWIHNSLIKDGHIIARCLVCYDYGNDLYMLQVFEGENARQFNCKAEYITKKL